MARDDWFLEEWMRRLPHYLYVVDLLAGKRVLEVECGLGHGARFLADRGAAHVLGIDASRAAIEGARDRHRRSNLEFRCDDPEAIEEEEGRFDCIFVSGQTMLRRDAVLEELRRVLAPSGCLVFAAASADRPAATGGVSYHEVLARLQPLFHPVRMIAQQPFVGMSLVPYARQRAPEPKAELDTTLVAPQPHSGGDATDYVAVCGGSSAPERGFVLVQLPMRGLSQGAGALGVWDRDAPQMGLRQGREGDARRQELENELEETRRKLERATDNWKAAEAKSDEVWRRVGELQTELGEQREKTVANAKRQRQAAQVSLARAMEEASKRFVSLQDELRRCRRGRDAGEETLRAAEAARAELARRVEELNSRCAELEGQARHKMAEFAKPREVSAPGLDSSGNDRGDGASVETLKQMLRSMQVELDDGLSLLRALERGLQEVQALDAATRGGQGGDLDRRVREMAMELGFKDAELTLLSFGVWSLQTRMRDMVAQVRKAGVAMRGMSAAEMIAVVDQLAENLGRYAQVAQEDGDGG